jgi:SpoVK/Ycf46/Vps4 family AAA+-type ATPase
MGRPVVERHASDLLSAWVGETEKRIAAAFREAEADGALLLFDEVDSFLRPRADATRSWEAMRIIEARLCATL